MDPISIHMCPTCRAVWCIWPDQTMSCVNTINVMGKCCDNTSMSNPMVYARQLGPLIDDSARYLAQLMVSARTDQEARLVLADQLEELGQLRMSATYRYEWDFVEWLSKLGQVEQITVYSVSGRAGERHGPVVLSLVLQRTSSINTEAWVEFAANVLDTVWRDCNQLNSKQLYSVEASHYAREPQPFARWLIKCMPGRRGYK